MPNWCENELKVSGEPKMIAKFRKLAKGEGSELSLAKLLPLPKELEGTTSPSGKLNKKLVKKYGADNWYDWQCGNWGTKWDIDASLNYEDDYNLEYFFSSAWSPPIEGLEQVSKKFKGLRFLLKYDEPGMGFAGIALIQNGETQDSSLNY